MKTVKYYASRTGAKFHSCDSFVRMVMGPVGSGKSVMCVMEILKRALEQKPDQNGLRRSRWAIVRNSYPELKSTSIKTWQDWIPDEVCPIVYTAPITGKFTTALPDKTKVQLEVLFIALDKVKDQKKLLSLELTGVWLNEVREIPKSIVDAFQSRVGRYPSKRDGGSKWFGIIADTNPPDDLSWYYQLAEVVKPEGWTFFRQPGGIIKSGKGYAANPEAENIEYLDGGHEYYLRQVAGAKQDYIDVMLCGQYGSLFDGKAVYEGSWEEKSHISESELEYEKGQPVVLGWDFGRTPACAICQPDRKGCFRVMAECYSEDSGIERFCEDVVKPYIALHFPGAKIYSYGDPAGAAKSQATEDSPIGTLERCGIITLPSISNEPQARTEAVFKSLRKMHGFLIDPRCKMLIRGFNGGYHYEVVGKIMGGGEVKYSSQPCKNMYSHIHDALQYAVLNWSPMVSSGKSAANREAARMVQVQKQAVYDPLAF